MSILKARATMVTTIMTLATVNEPIKAAMRSKGMLKSAISITVIGLNIAMLRSTALMVMSAVRPQAFE